MIPSVRNRLFHRAPFQHDYKCIINHNVTWDKSGTEWPAGMSSLLKSRTVDPGEVQSRVVVTGLGECGGVGGEQEDVGERTCPYG